VLNNPVGNAVKYNRDGGSVTVRARHDSEWVRIDVEDTGIGIAPENIDQCRPAFALHKSAMSGTPARLYGWPNQNRPSDRRHRDPLRATTPSRASPTGQDNDRRQT